MTLQNGSTVETVGGNSSTSIGGAVIVAYPPGGFANNATIRAQMFQQSTIPDLVPPTIGQLPDISVNTAPGQCSALVIYGLPSVSDNCHSIGAPVCNPPPGSIFDKGSKVVTCHVTDAAGNVSPPSTFTVTVVDLEKPTLNCPANIVVSAPVDGCSAVVSYPAPSVSDNCPGVGVATCNPPSGSSFNVGDTPVNCTARDASQNLGTCSFTVTVRDATAPVITCSGNIIVECAPPDGVPVSFNITATDLCDTDVTVLCVPPSGSVFQLGARAVSCTATDPWGNRDSCTFSVLLVGTNCTGNFVIQPSTSPAGQITRFPLLSSYPCGTCVEITAMPAANWTFMGWLGDTRGLVNPVTITMNQDKCVEPVFGTPQSIGNGANGYGVLEPLAPLYPYGSTVRAAAGPNPGYYFSHWTNDLSGTQNPLEYSVSVTNALITPVFQALPSGYFSLFVNVSGRGRVRQQRVGGPTPALLALTNVYPSGSNLVLLAIPEPGQKFDGWIVGPGPFTFTNPLPISMTSSRWIEARFSRKPVLEVVRCQDEIIEGIFRLQVKGSLLERYIVEASSLTSEPAVWTPVAQGSNVLGSFQFDDPFVPGVSKRFYRAILAP